MAGLSRLISACIGAVAIATATKPATAQQEGLAESLFREARQDMRRGQADQACPKFAESYRLDPSIGTLLNLGLCEQEVGHTATAWTKLCQFVDAAPADDARVAIAKKKIEELARVLPKIRIILATNDPDTTVKLDGVELHRASLGVALPVDPGAHVVALTAASGESRETTVQLRAAQTLDVTLARPESSVRPPVQPAAAPLPSKASPPVPPKRRSRRAPPPTSMQPDNGTERTVAYLVGAAGIVGLGTAAVFGGMAVHDKGVVAVHCPDHLCQDQAGLDAARSGARNEIVANVAFVAGAALLTTGAIVLWHSTKSSVTLSAAPRAASLAWVGLIE